MLECIGSSAVQGFNLETKRTAVAHKDDLKLYMCPDTRHWKTNSEVLSEMLDEFKMPTPAYFARARRKDHLLEHLRCMQLLTKATSDVHRSLVVVQAEVERTSFLVDD